MTRVLEPAPPRRSGPRQARRRAERRSRRRRRLLLCALGVGVVVALVVVVVLLLARAAEAPPSRSGDVGDSGTQQRTLLLVTRADGGPASSATLLAEGTAAAPASVVFVPVRTLLEVPGVGLDRLGLAAQYGGPELLAASLDNVLGITIDTVVLLDDAALPEVLDRAGELDVRVPARLVARDADGDAEVRFEPGAQRLDGRRLAELWSFRGRGEDELAAFPRRQAVLDAVLTALGGGTVDAHALFPPDDELVTPGEAGGALRDLVAALAQARTADRLAYDLLPVEPFGGDGEGGTAYRIDETAAARLVESRLAASRPADATGAGLRVQVLNGVGTPGVGQLVDRRLAGGGFRVVLTDNARSFDFDDTQILVYDEDAASLAAARTVRQRLGVGSIRVSRQPQSVVDLTIVVGRDLLDADG